MAVYSGCPPLPCNALQLGSDTMNLKKAILLPTVVLLIMLVTDSIPQLKVTTMKGSLYTNFISERNFADVSNRWRTGLIGYKFKLQVFLRKFHFRPEED